MEISSTVSKIEKANPIISVIIPAYNIESYLPECLDSILNQRYKNIEIVLVNGGSTDQTGLINDECQGKYSTTQKYCVA